MLPGDGGRRAGRRGQNRLCLALLLRPLSRLRAGRLEAADKIRLFEAIFRDYVDTGGKKTGGEKALDFDQDAGLIYAAFAQCYGLDLVGKDRGLHWWKFAQLLGGLPEDTRLMQVASIRTRPLPKPTRYNAEERQSLLRLKGLYRLEETAAERERRLQDGPAAYGGHAGGNGPKWKISTEDR